MNYQKPQQLTIQQAISRAKKATKKGKIADAVELYTAVLAHQPNHPIAKKALRKLQKSQSQNQPLEINTPSPSQDQINSLVNLYQSGQMAKAEQACRELLNTYPQTLIAINVLGSALQGQGKLQEAVQAFNKAIQLNPDFAEAYSNRGNILKDLGRFDESLQNYDKAIQLKPDFADAYSNRGNILKDLGRLNESLQNYDKAIQLKSGFADAYSNRGIVLKDLGRLDEALQNYDKAIQLKPDFASAYSNRGNALKDLGRLDEALQNYDKAIQLRPDFASAYSNRGIALQELGQFQSAMTSHQNAVSINPHNGLFWAGFADGLQAVKLTSYNDELGQYLFQLLEQPTVRPKNVAKAVIEVLHYHPIVARALELSKSDHSYEDIDHLTGQLSAVPLLLRVMELSTIADLDVEKMLTKMRKAMLHKAACGAGEALGIPFSVALAMHCFTNEYVFSESEDEKQELELFQKKIEVILKKEGTVPPTWIAVLGAYRPLYSFSWANALMGTGWVDEIKKVIVAQVDNVREEQALCSKVSRLSSIIDDKVSQLVRTQYEENPYPRWINTGLSEEPRTTRQVLQSVNPQLNVDVQRFSNKPDILIAGCGTGQHALSTASRFRNCNVLAIDLSLTSLSYAKRKTQELGIKNIEYMQGDILKLDQLEKEFDIIECAGVLHHMDDPLAGWKILVGKLRAGGVMKIGLYSQIARRHIVEARREIAKKGYTSSPDDIRRYREELINKDLALDSKTSKLIDSGNFYSLSECRDLLFHVQEHRFTLPQIEVALNDLGLKFLGFEIKKSWTRRTFTELYSDKDALVSLPLWHQFELQNPNIFQGMYQFWCQKVS